MLQDMRMAALAKLRRSEWHRDQGRKWAVKSGGTNVQRATVRDENIRYFGTLLFLRPFETVFPEPCAGRKLRT